jgi:1,4-dihydroxy-2-naphthoate octaprenyltransferase
MDIRWFLQLVRPLHLLLAALTYTFGLGVAKYLGNPFHSGSLLLGLLIVVLGQAGMSLMSEAFRPVEDPPLGNLNRFEWARLRISLLYLAISFLGTAAGLAYLLFLNDLLPSAAMSFLLLSLVIIAAGTVPPLRLVDRGFGELLTAAHLAYIVPSIAFLLQAGLYHRLLFFLAIAYFLVLDFSSFAGDQKYRRATFLRLISWERAVPLHHSLVAASYVLFLIASLLGPSLELLWPAFLTMPFAALQINQLRRISLGEKPNWVLLNSTALGVFGLTAYFLTLTFWLN